MTDKELCDQCRYYGDDDDYQNCADCATLALNAGGGGVETETSGE